MTTVSRTFDVTSSAGAVIDYLKDFSNAEEWDPGTVRCRRTDGSGPITVGATWHNTSKIAGVTSELTYTLETLTGDTLVFQGHNDSATSTDTITVRPAGAGAEVTYRADIQITTLFGRIAAPLTKLLFERIAGQTERQLTAVLNRL